MKTKTNVLNLLSTKLFTKNKAGAKRYKILSVILASGLLTSSVYAKETSEVNLEPVIEVIEHQMPDTLITLSDVTKTASVEQEKHQFVVEPKPVEQPYSAYLEITAESLNIRKTPDLMFEPLGAYLKRDLVAATGKMSNGWYKLASGYYINGKYTKQRTDITSQEAFEKERAKVKESRKPKVAPAYTTDSKTVPVSGSGTSYKNISMTNEERDLLARLIFAEAGGESFEGQVAVVKVVFNRILDGRFPNSVSGVVYAQNQFTPVITGKIDRVKATDTQYKAIDTALSSNDNLYGAIYFYAPGLVKSTWFESLKTVASICVHQFKVN